MESENRELQKQKDEMEEYNKLFKTFNKSLKERISELENQGRETESVLLEDSQAGLKCVLQSSVMNANQLLNQSLQAIEIMRSNKLKRIPSGVG